jgi:signal peptidase I
MADDRIHLPTVTRRILRGAFELAFLALIAVAAWFLWPASLGGGTSMIAVQGTSMQPTYHTGDLLMVRHNGSPDIGDVIVYSIPEDEPGGGNRVVHRIVARRDDGSIVTQGDNRDTPDPFHITEQDVVGSPVLLLP